MIEIPLIKFDDKTARVSGINPIFPDRDRGGMPGRNQGHLAEVEADRPPKWAAEVLAPLLAQWATTSGVDRMGQSAALAISTASPK